MAEIEEFEDDEESGPKKPRLKISDSHEIEADTACFILITLAPVKKRDGTDGFKEVKTYHRDISDCLKYALNTHKGVCELPSLEAALEFIKTVSDQMVSAVKNWDIENKRKEIK